MAAYAAHLTRTRGDAPSVFQLAAQEALAVTVRPALRKLVEFLSAVHPGRCGWLERWFDEVFLLLDATLQYHYLKHYAASFSESFYGLTRVPLRGASEWGGSRLPAALERASLALLVLGPYLAHKAQRHVDRWREDREDGRLPKGSGGRLRAAAVVVFGAAHSAHALWRLAQLARYLSGGVRGARLAPHSPALRLAGVALAAAPAPAPAQHHRHAALGWGDALRSMLKGDFTGGGVSFSLVASALALSAEWAAFGVQAARWWQAHQGPTSSASNALQPPPPPNQSESNDAQWRNVCPLCRRAWRVPTVLPVSGLVFCYACISRHLRAEGACPVSGFPAAHAQLIRVYLPDQPHAND